MNVDPKEALVKIDDEPIQEDPEDTEEIGQSDTARPYAVWSGISYCSSTGTLAAIVSWRVSNRRGSFTQVRNFSSSDITASRGNWIGTVSPSGASTSFAVSLRAPRGLSGRIRFRVRRNSATRVSNSRSGPISDVWSGYVSVDTRRPSLNSISSRNVNERSSVSISASGSRINSYSLSGGSWLSISSSTGRITGTAPSRLHGCRTYSFTVTATGAFGTDTERFNITVVNIDKPTPSTVTSRSYNENVTITPITVSVSPFYSAENWSLTKLSSGSTGTEDWLRIGIRTNIGVTLTGTTPPVSGNKTYQYRLTASNNAGSNSTTFTITVTDTSKPIIGSISDRSVDEGTLITIPLSISGETSVSVSLTSSGTNWLTYNRQLRASGTVNKRLVGIAAPVTAAQGSVKYTFRVRATNAGGNTDRSFTVTVKNTTAPTVYSIASKSYSESTPVGFTARGSNVTRWSISRRSGSSSFLSINSSTGRISGRTPPVTGAQGTRTWTYRVTGRNNTRWSSYKDFTFTVRNTTAPTIGSVNPGTVDERSSVSFTPSGTDVKTWSLTKTSSAGSDWLSICSSSGRISGRARSITRGTFSYTYRITARNNTSTVATRTFTIRVRNTTPIINSYSGFTINENTAVSGQRLTGDAIRSWSLALRATGTSWLSISSSSGSLSGTSPPVIRGTAVYGFRVTATGLDGTTATKDFNVRVTNTTGITLTDITNRTVNEKSSVRIPVSVSPSANVVQTWTLTFLTASSTGTVDWLNFDSAGPRVYGTAPNFARSQCSLTYTYELEAENNVGDDSIQFTITVKDATPKLSSIPNFNVNEGTRIRTANNIRVSAVNTNAYSISMITSGTNWLNIDSSGRITGTAPSQNIGSKRYTFRVTATNSPASTERDTEDFTATVINTTIPSINAIANQTVYEGRSISITASASDNSIVSSWSMSFIASKSTSGETGSWLSFCPSTRTASGTAPPISGANKKYTYEITASNNAGSDTEEFTITVADNVYTVTWDDETYTSSTNKISANIQFSDSVTNISSSDFDIVNASGTAQTGWTFDTISSTTNANTDVAISATAPSNTNASFKLRILANSVRFAGSSTNNGPSLATSSASISVDNRSPISVVAFGAPIETETGSTANFSLVLSHTIPNTELTVSDFSTSTSNASIASVTPIGISVATNSNRFRITANQPTNSMGTYSITLAANSISAGTNYKAGPTTANTSANVTYNTTPIVTVIRFSTPVGLQTGSSTTLTLTLSHSVSTSEICTGDFTAATSTSINSVTAINPSGGLASQYSVIVTNPTSANGSYTIIFKKDAIPTGTGYRKGPPANFTSQTVNYNTRPAVAVSSFPAPTGTQTGSTSIFSIGLSQVIPVSQLTTSDFSTSDTNATLNAVRPAITGQTSANVFRVIVNNPTNSSGTYTIIFKRNSIADGTTYRRGPTANYTSETVTYDTRSSVSVSSFTAPSDIQRTSSTILTLTLSHAVSTSEIGTGDFTPAASTSISSVTAINPSGGLASQYSVTVTNPTNANGSYTIAFKKDAISTGTSYKQGPSADFTSGTITYNTRGNGATWSDESYCSTSNKLSANIRFAGAITGISASDFEIINSRNSVVTGWTFDTSTATVSANTKLLISASAPANTNASFAIRIKQNSVRYDGSSTDNGPDSNTDSSSVAVDNRGKILVSSFTAPTGTIRSSTSTFKLVLSEDIPITEITTADFTPAASTTISSVSPIGTGSVNNEYNVVVNNPVNTSGTYSVIFKRNAISASTTYDTGPEADFASTAVTYDTIPFSVTWGTPTFNTTTNKLSATISFSHPVTNIESCDFLVVNSGGTSQTNWTFDTPTGSASANSNITISATPPENTNDSFGFSIKANSVRFAGASSNNGPPLVVRSIVISVDNRPIIPNSFAYQDRLVIPTVPAALDSFNDWTTTGSNFYFVRANPRGTNIVRTDTCFGSINSNFIVLNSNEGASRITNDGTHLYVVVDTSTQRQLRKYLISTGAQVTSFNVTLPRNPYDALAWNSDDNQLYVFNKVLYSQRNTRTLDYSRYNSSGTLLGSHSLSTGTHRGVVTATYDPETNNFYCTAGGGGGYAVYSIKSDYQIELDTDPLFTNPPNFTSPSAITYYNNELRVGSRIGTTRYYFRLTRFTFTGSWTNVTFTGSAIRGTLVIKGGAISEFNKTDLEVIDATSGLRQSGWVFNTVASTIADRSSASIIATPPANTNGTFKIRLKALTISRGTGTNNRPYQNMDTIPIRVDNRPQLNVTSFTAPSGTQRGTTSTFNLIFDRDIPTSQLTNSDFTVSDSNASISSISVVGISGGSEDEYDIIINNPTDTSGTYTISLNANSISESTSYKSGPVSMVSSTVVTYDTTDSGIRGTWGPVTVNETDRSASSTLTFSEDPGTGFSIPDDIRIQKRSGTAPTFIWTTERESNWEISISGSQTSTEKPIKAVPAPSVEEGTYRFLLVENALGSNTGGEVSGNFIIGEDMATPAPIISGGTFCPSSNQVNFSIYWSSVSVTQLSQFTSSKLSVVGGGSGSTATLGTRCGTSYPVTVTGLPPNSSGSVQIQIEEDAVGESLPVESQMVPYDTTVTLPVTFSIGNAYASASATDTTALTTPLDEATVYVEVSTNSRDATGLTSSDFIVSGGCVGSLVTLTTSRIWRLGISIENDTKGYLTVAIPTNVVTESNQPASDSFRYDRTGTARPPTFTVGSAYSASTGGSALTGELTVANVYVEITTNSRNATGLTASDFIISGGCPGNLTVITAKRAWRLQVGIPNNNKGVLTVSIPSNVVTESNQPASNTFCYDRTTAAEDVVPAAIIERGYFIKSTGTVHFTVYWANTTAIQFPEFTNADLSVTGGGSATNAVLGTRCGNSYPVTVIPLPSNSVGHIELTIAAGAIGSSLSASSTCVPYDTRLPVTFSIGNAYASASESDIIALTTPLDEATVYIEVSTNSRDATGLTSSDFIVSNGCAGTLTTLTANRLWRLAISIEDNTKGTLTVSLPSGVVEQSNQPTSNSFTFDRTVSTPSVTFSIGNAYASSSSSDITALTLPLDDAEVWVEISTDAKDGTGLTASDFIVSGACAGTLTSLTANRIWRLQVYIENDTKGTLTVSLPTNVVTQGNQPASKSFTFDREIASTSLVPAATITGGTFCSSTNSVHFTIFWANTTATQFPEFTNADLSVTGGGAATNGILGTRDGNSYPVTVIPLPANSTGHIELTIAAGAIGSSLSASSTCVPYDTRMPTTAGIPPGAIFTIPNSIETGSTTDIAVNFGEQVHGLTNSDFTITGHSPSPSHVVLARSFEIGLALEVSRAPSVNFSGSVTDPPTISSVTRSPRGPQMGASQLWVIRLLSPFRAIDQSELVVTRGTLVGSPIFIDSLYTLRVTNPTSSSGTLNAVLARSSVTSVDDTMIGPQLPQNSGSWAFDSRVKPSFTIGNAYPDTTINTSTSVPIKIATVYVEIFTDAKDANALTASDFIVSGACAGALTETTANRIWRLRINVPDNDRGTLTIALPANSVSEGNDPVSKSFEFDRTEAADQINFSIDEVYASSSASDVTVLTGTITRNTVYIEISIDVDDDDATGLTSSDFIISGGCPGTLTELTTNRKWRLEVSILDGTKGFLTVAIPSGSVEQGNPPASKSFEFDLTGDVTNFAIKNAYATAEVSDTAVLGIPLTGSSVHIELETLNNKDATGLSAADFIISGGCIGTLTQLTAKRKWRIQVHIPNDVKGDLTVSLPTNVITEGNSSISKTFSFNRILTSTPVLFTVGNAYASRDASDITALTTPLDEATVWVEIFTDAKDATGLTSSDFIVSGGCAGTLAELTANRIWRLEISIEDATKGYLTVSMPSNVVIEGNQPASNSFRFDRTSVTATGVPPGAIFTIPNSIETGSTTDIAVDFGERVLGLANSDFTITGHSPIPSHEILGRDFQIELAAAVSTAPTVTLNIAGSDPPTISSVTRSPQAQPSGDTTLWLIRLSRPFRDLSNTEVQISGSPITQDPIFIDSLYTLQITNPTSSSGTLNAVLARSSVTSVDDSTSGPELPQNSGSWAFDSRVKPTFSIGNAYASEADTDIIALTQPLGEATAWIEIFTDAKDATGLTNTDFIVGGACAGSLEILTENRIWRLAVNIPNNDRGTLTIALPANSVCEGNDPVSKSFEFDRDEAVTSAPYVRSSGLPTDKQTGQTVSFTVTTYVNDMQTNIDGLTADDFIITSDEGSIDPTIT